jgi:hypothetical protein
MAKAKIKVHWRGSVDGKKHAVRQVADEHLDVAVCGAKVRENWTAPGTRAKAKDVRCAKCAVLEPKGMGPGGSAYRGVA